MPSCLALTSRINTRTGVVAVVITQRAYRKRAERFRLSAITHKGKALSLISNEDCIEDRDFLADPQPRSRLCGDRGRERWSPLSASHRQPQGVCAEQARRPRGLAVR